MTATARRFIIDHSAWARVATSSAVNGAVAALVATERPTSIYVCPPVVAEMGYSACSFREHERLRMALSAFTECPHPPSSFQVLRVQGALWGAGLVRAVGATDTVIAAWALANDATVVHYDSDFAHVAQVVPEFKHRWIVPRGSI